MPGTAVYLEASKRTQDLLNIKWALRSSGYGIASTWHEDQSVTSASKRNWLCAAEQVQSCDLLVVICPAHDEAAPELAMVAGFAVARGIKVAWVGPPLQSLSPFLTVRQFDGVDEFRRSIVMDTLPRPASARESLAA